MPDIDEERIRERAFILSEEAGHPDGQDQHFWHLARQQLIAEEQAAELARELPDAVAAKPD